MIVSFSCFLLQLLIDIVCYFCCSLLIVLIKKNIKLMMNSITKKYQLRESDKLIILNAIIITISIKSNTYLNKQYI